MRRISLAMALVGAVAAAGCSGGNTPSGSGSSAGSPGATFTVKVRGETYNYTDPVTNTSVARPVGGTITSTPAGLNCGEAAAVCSFDFPWGTPVVINASTSPMAYHVYAGDCSGNAGCTLTGNADKLVLVRFAASATALGSHPNFSDAGIHGVEYMKFISSTAGAYTCNSALCHGTALRGAGLAPSCYQCHGLPTTTLHEDVGQTDAVNNHGAWSSYVNRSGCQRCHTTGGFQDYVGVDGTPNYLGTTYAISSTTQVAGTLRCWGCHNAASSPARTGLTVINFPSPTTVTTTTQTITYRSVTTDNVTALCGQCHQGRESTNSINQKIGSTAADAQLPAAVNSFPNPHYLGAAGTVFGGKAQMWGQFSNQTYTGANAHGGAGSCTACHDPHTGDLPADGAGADQIGGKCGTCHFNEAGARITTFLGIGGLEEVRQFGFEGDIDGDTIEESLKEEIEGLETTLYAALRAYATNVAGTSILYNGAAHPYFYVDANGDGVQAGYDAVTGLAIPGFDPTLAESAAYNKFTPRSLRGAFNLKWAHAEPGAWAHNPRYAIEVLFDSIADLNAGLGANAVAFDGKRGFNGHFGGAEDVTPYAAMVYHYYQTGTSGFSSGACYQCHGGQVGVETYLASAPAALTSAAKNANTMVTAMQCGTCHTLNGTNMTAIRTASPVYFPPQKNSAAGAGQVSFTAAQLPPGNAICATCHGGRENGASITLKIGSTPSSTWSLSATNPHYLGAAGVMMGTNAKVMYEYAGNAYTGYPVFWSLTNGGSHGSPHGGRCASCHAAKKSEHTFEIALGQTVAPGVWGGAFPIAGMLPGATNTAACTGCHAGPYALEPKALEFEEASAELLAAIRAYAVDPINLASIQAAVNGATFGGGTTGQPAVTLDGSTVTGICYFNDAHPYYFLEVGGTCRNVGDATHTALSFAKFNPTLLKASYNYLWTQKEPGAWAHNEYYVLQAIYDSIVDLGRTPTFQVHAVTDAAHNVVCDPLNRPATLACP